MNKFLYSSIQQGILTYIYTKPSVLINNFIICLDIWFYHLTKLIHLQDCLCHAYPLHLCIYFVINHISYVKGMLGFFFGLYYIHINSGEVTFFSIETPGCSAHYIQLSIYLDLLTYLRDILQFSLGSCSYFLQTYLCIYQLFSKSYLFFTVYCFLFQKLKGHKNAYFSTLPSIQQMYHIEVFKEQMQILF